MWASQVRTLAEATTDHRRAWHRTRSRQAHRGQTRFRVILIIDRRVWLRPSSRFRRPSRDYERLAEPLEHCIIYTFTIHMLGNLARLLTQSS